MVTGNTIPGDYTTWSGECGCRHDGRVFNASSTVVRSIFDAMVLPTLPSLVLRRNSSDASSPFDLCRSAYEVCEYALGRIGCPLSLIVNVPCAGAVYGSNMYGSIEHTRHSVDVRCSCGQLRYLDTRSHELLINAIVAQTVSSSYLYLPPSKAAYTLVVQSNPFRQLTQPSDACIPMQ